MKKFVAIILILVSIGLGCFLVACMSFNNKAELQKVQSPDRKYTARLVADIWIDVALSVYLKKSDAREKEKRIPMYGFDKHSLKTLSLKWTSNSEKVILYDDDKVLAFYDTVKNVVTNVVNESSRRKEGIILIQNMSGQSISKISVWVQGKNYDFSDIDKNNIEIKKWKLSKGDSAFVVSGKFVDGKEISGSVGYVPVNFTYSDVFIKILPGGKVEGVQKNGTSY